MAKASITVADVLSFLAMPSVLRVPLAKGSDEVTEIPVAEIFTAHPELLRVAACSGMTGKLNNVSLGGLSKQLERQATVKDLATTRANIVKAWANGSWNAGRTSERDTLPLREAFYREKNAVTPAARKALDKAIRAKVTERFGEKDSATFGRFLDAIAAEYAEARGIEVVKVRDALESKYTDLALEMIREQKAATADIAVDFESLGI